MTRYVLGNSTVHLHKQTHTQKKQQQQQQNHELKKCGQGEVLESLSVCVVVFVYHPVL